MELLLLNFVAADGSAEQGFQANTGLHGYFVIPYHALYVPDKILGMCLRVNCADRDCVSSCLTLNFMQTLACHNKTSLRSKDL